MKDEVRKREPDYVARNNPIPHSGKYVLNRFSLVNPDEVSSDQEKVLYALWHIGELPYYELLLYANLTKSELDKVLDHLLKESLVYTPFTPTHTLENTPDYSNCTFRICR